MFDIGFVEVLLLGTVCLIVLGPERLPHAARLAGAWLGKSRRAFNDLKYHIELEVQANELKERIEQEAQNAQQMISKAQVDLQSPLNASENPDKESNNGET